MKEIAVVRQDVSEYMPALPRMSGIYWHVGVKLPDSYKDWITTLSGRRGFRKDIEQDVVGLFKVLMRGPWGVTIRWGERGASFDLPVDGSASVSGSAGVFVDGSDVKLSEYRSDNLETARQAYAGWGALTVYMKHIMVALDFCERQPEVASEWERLIRPTTTEIRVEGRDELPEIRRY